MNPNLTAGDFLIMGLYHFFVKQKGRIWKDGSCFYFQTATAGPAILTNYPSTLEETEATSPNFQNERTWALACKYIWNKS